jgi:hypothetical protein
MTCVYGNNERSFSSAHVDVKNINVVWIQKSCTPYTPSKNCNFIKIVEKGKDLITTDTRIITAFSILKHDLKNEKDKRPMDITSTYKRAKTSSGKNLQTFVDLQFP